MVDAYLPYRSLKLRSLFLDYNAFFASVEQQERPELRGKPIAVAPSETDATVAIASSQEARKFGVKCLTNIGDARRMCPDLIVVPATPKLYMAYHEALRQVVSNILPEEKVHSIDEMSYRLIGDECEPQRARRLALEMKAAIRKRIGEYVTCSIGIAPNTFLAKTATEIEKPNGLVVIEPTDIPGRVLSLKLTDLCGINVRMKRRLNSAMIFTVEDLYAATARELRLAFGSVVGERWYYLLRGFELPERSDARKSLGHSHVLHPALRNDKSVGEVILRLLQKASARLRSEKLWTTAMTVYVAGKEKDWSVDIRMPPTQDTVTLNEHFLAAWKARDFAAPYQCGVTFHELRTGEAITPSLFDPTVERSRLNEAVDNLNSKYGKNKVYLAGMEHAKEHATEKIAFNKTWLFSEGRGDNDYEGKVAELLASTPETR